MNEHAIDEETKQIVEEEIGNRKIPEDKIEEILDRMESLEVELEEDPIVRGPKFLIKQLAKCRNYLNEAQVWHEYLQKHRVRFKRHLNNLESEYEIRYNDIRVNDEKVQDFGAAADRKSYCEHKLRELKYQIMNLESEISEIDSVIELVSNRIRNLRETTWDIRKQKELIEDEINLGGKWSTDSDAEEVDVSDTDFEEDELENAVETNVEREQDDEGSNQPESDDNLQTEDLLSENWTENKGEGPDLSEIKVPTEEPVGEVTSDKGEEVVEEEEDPFDKVDIGDISL